MTDDNSNASSEENLVDMDNLDTFSENFFSDESVQKTDEPEEAAEENEEEVSENEDDALAPSEDNENEDEADESDDESEEDEPEEEEKPKPRGKKSAKERIEELYASDKQKEREIARLLAELEKTKAPIEDNTKTEPKPLREQLSAEAPNPDAVDEDGELIYKLGEFDPIFIRDLTRFTINEERKAAQEAEAKEVKQREVEAAQEKLKSSWLEKVQTVEEELPDIREKLASMEDAFEDVDPDYGEFLAATIMSCDFGPQIMYYLSQNIGEAQKIVASGPAAATLAIGRLDARFNKPAPEKRNNKPSGAPTPPANRTRGSGSRANVAPDTMDLKAFEREFYVKK